MVGFARRYAPLAVALALFVGVVVALPSKPIESLTSSRTAAGVRDRATAAAVQQAQQQAAAAAAQAQAAAAGGGAGPAGQAGRAGSTSHCVQGRQFDPAIDYYAPPCVPKWGGGNNGGATYRGVTASQVKIVQYYPRQNAAVDTLAAAFGAKYTSADLQNFADKVEKYLNDRYEFYGRKAVLKVVQGDCVNVPPDPACFRNEFRRIVDAEQPYAVMWNTPLCSACFDELSQLGVVNVGGYHFQDSYARARAPYHWDVQESGTQINQAIGEFWCSNLKGQKAVFAADRQGSTNGQARKLGVISANDPQNEGAVATLKSVLKSCGETLGGEYYYSQDISTAPQQAQTAIRTMRDGGVTSLVCLCDAVGGLLLISGEGQNGYYPENIIGGFGFTDADVAGQAFIGSVGCANGEPCAFNRAVGVSSLTAQEPTSDDRGARMWRLGGGQGDPPFTTAVQVADYWSLIGTLVQAAGPNLNPLTMEAGVRAYGIRGGGATNEIARGFPAGSYAWAQDMRVVYFDPKKPSPFNGKPGTFVQVGGRLLPGQYRQGLIANVPVNR